MNLLVMALFLSSSGFAKDLVLKGKVPSEIESDGGHSLGLDNGGMAALSEQSSVRANPALLTLEKQYTVSGGYHWPAFGRAFYQAGVVDSKTSPIAAGLSYTGFVEKHAVFTPTQDPQISKDENATDFYDTPIASRLSVGIAQVFQDKVALGLSVQHVRSAEEELPHRYVNTLGLGAAALITPQLRFGASLSNLGNEKAENIAPQVMRFGIAFTFLGGDVTAHLDYKQRQRIDLESEEVPAYDDLSTAALVDPTEKQDISDEREKLATGSFSIRTLDLLRILGGFSQAIDGSKRQSASGGIALVNEGFAFSYLVSRPYLTESLLHHGVNLSLGISL